MTDQLHIREYSGGRHRRKLLTPNPKPENGSRVVSPGELGPNCPPALAEYLTRRLSEDPEGECAENYDADKASWLHQIDALIGMAAHTLSEPASSIPGLFEFTFEKETEERFLSFMAELRAIVYLAANGHYGIKRLPSKGKKQAEGISRLGSDQYAWEVKCLGVIRDWERRYDHGARASRSTPSDKSMLRLLTESVISRWKDSASGQLNASATEWNCTRSLLIVVVDYAPFLAHLSRDVYPAVVKDAHGKLGLSDCQHLAVLTDHENCVYPAWDSDRRASNWAIRGAE